MQNQYRKKNRDSIVSLLLRMRRSKQIGPDEIAEIRDLTEEMLYSSDSEKYGPPFTTEDYTGRNDTEKK